MGTKTASEATPSSIILGFMFDSFVAANVRDQVSPLAFGATSCDSKNRDRSAEGTGINYSAPLSFLLLHQQLALPAILLALCLSVLLVWRRKASKEKLPLHCWLISLWMIPRIRCRNQSPRNIAHTNSSLSQIASFCIRILVSLSNDLKNTRKKAVLDQWPHLLSSEDSLVKRMRSDPSTRCIENRIGLAWLREGYFSVANV